MNTRLTKRDIYKILAISFQFRHSTCCLGLEVTEQNLLEVKKFMRHQNLETTMIYADHGEFLKNNIAEEKEKKLL